MQRDLAALSNQFFDLLVIGGGMHGACVAWEATLRGLSVALVEQADFASGTSANSLKVIHGGLRYLQNADFKRMRQSIRARQVLMRIAPHLVHPLPVLVPIYGHGTKGREAMAIALKLNDLISGDRNLPLADPQKHIPPGQILSREACLAQLPDLAPEGLTGAARFHDAQAYNSEQLVLAFLQSAAQRGAQVANYVRLVDFGPAQSRDNPHHRVTCVTVEDQLSGDRFPIRARTIVNAAGPWIGPLMATGSGGKTQPQPLAKAMNLVTRPLLGANQAHAVGITGRAPGSRLFFIAPWRGYSLVGTWYGPDSEQRKPPVATRAEVESFLAEVNQAYPSFQLTLADVRWVHCGLLPSTGLLDKSGEVQLTKHFQLRDHRPDGLAGVLSVSGVKYTTALDLARRAVDWVFRDRDESAPPSISHLEPLHGGHIERFDTFLTTALRSYAQRLPSSSLKRLVYNYGSEYPAVLQPVFAESQAGSESVCEDAVLAAEVRYALQCSMPQTLSDVIFRRTELGSAGHPGDGAITLCAQVMRDALGWDDLRQQAEIEQVQQRFRERFVGAPPLAAASVTAAAITPDPMPAPV